MQLRSIEKRLQELLNKTPDPEQCLLNAKLEELQLEILQLTCGQLTVSPMGICQASPPLGMTLAPVVSVAME